MHLIKYLISLYICINNNHSSDKYVFLDETFILQLSVSVNGPCLPAVLPGETYSCHLADNQGRYNITVPAITVVDGRNYTCNITNANLSYEGVISGRLASI